MKKTIVLLIAFLSLISINAQKNYYLNNYYEGYIIKHDGTKVRGYIKYLSEKQRYEKVIFKPSKDSKKERFKPKSIKGYKVADVVYHSIQYKDVMFKSLRFLVLEDEGCINRYSHRTFKDGAWEGEIILSKEDEAYTGGTFLFGFSKKMSKFLKDDKVIASKIKNKEKGYKLLSMLKIVNEYNANCAK